MQVSPFVCEFIFASSVGKVLDNSLYISVPKSLKYILYGILGLIGCGSQDASGRFIRHANITLSLTYAAPRIRRP